MFSGFIGLSPALDFSQQLPPAPILLLLRFIAWIAPLLRIKAPFDPKLIVSDEAAFKEWEKDPLVCRDKVTAAYLTTIASSADEIMKQASKIENPMMLMWGTGDEVVSKLGCEMLLEKCKSTDRSLKLYPGAFHNILQEPGNKGEAQADIANWIIAHSHKAAV